MFPAATFLKMGDLTSALYAMVLQGTLIGWIPAIMWAKKAWEEENAMPQVKKSIEQPMQEKTVTTEQETKKITPPSEKK